MNTAHLPFHRTDFGHRLWTWRLKHGLTLSALAVRIDERPSVLSEVENGLRPPSRELRRKLTQVMEQV